MDFLTRDEVTYFKPMRVCASLLALSVAVYAIMLYTPKGVDWILRCWVVLPLMCIAFILCVLGFLNLPEGEQEKCSIRLAVGVLAWMVPMFMFPYSNFTLGLIVASCLVCAIWMWSSSTK